jgi:hypothetical protein
MSRQLVFSSTISIMVMAAFALSTTAKAHVVVERAPVVQVGTVGGR